MTVKSTLVILLSLLTAQFSYAASCLQSFSYAGSCTGGKSKSGSAICLDGVSKSVSYGTKCTAQSTILSALESACANDCFVKVCEPNSTNNACTGTNGSGVRTCNSNGSGFVGSCNLNQCNSGYNLQLVNGVYTCVQNVCVPNSTNNPCSNATGSGIISCNSSGSGYVGVCNMNQCTSGYHLETLSGFTGVKTCVQNVCNPDPNQTNPLACESTPTNSATSHRYCNANGSGYNACTIDSCSSGFNLQYVSGGYACISGYAYQFKYYSQTITPNGSVSNVNFASGLYWDIWSCWNRRDNHVADLDSANAQNAAFLASPGSGWRAAELICPSQRSESYPAEPFDSDNYLYNYPAGCFVNSNTSTTAPPMSQPPNYMCP